MASRPARIIVSVVDRASKTFAFIGSSMKMLGAAAVALGAYAIGKVLIRNLTNAVKVAADFEESLSKIRAVTRATETDMTKLGDQAMKLGRTTVFTAREVAKAQNVLAKAGFEVKEVHEAIPGVMALAAAGELEVGNAAKVAAQLVRTFGLEASATTDVADLLSKAANTSNTTVEELGEAFAFAGPAASLMGLSMTETAAALQLIADRGLRASLGGTALGKTITTLGGQVNKLEGATGLQGLEKRLFTSEGAFVGWKDAIGVMKEAGIDASNVFNVFGVRAGKAAGFLVKFDKELDENTARLLDRAGNAALTAAIKLDNLKGDVTLLKSAWEGLNIIVGRVMQDSFRILAQQVTYVINSLTDAGTAGDLFSESLTETNTFIELFAERMVWLSKWVSRIWTGIKFLFLSALGQLIEGVWFSFDKMMEPIRMFLSGLARLGYGFADEMAAALDKTDASFAGMVETMHNAANDAVADNMLFTHSLEGMGEELKAIRIEYKRTAEERKKAREELEASQAEGRDPAGAADVVSPSERGGGSKTVAERNKQQLDQHIALWESQLALTEEFSAEETRLRRHILEARQFAELEAVQDNDDALLSMQARHVNELLALDKQLADDRIEILAREITQRADMIDIEMIAASDRAEELAAQAEQGSQEQLDKALAAMENEQNLKLSQMTLGYLADRLALGEHHLAVELLDLEHKARMIEAQEAYSEAIMRLIAAQAQFEVNTDAAKRRTTRNLAFQAAEDGVRVMGELFGKSKAFAYAGAVISTARGVSNALEVKPPPLAWAMAAITAAKGLVEIKKIKSTNVPKHQTGGILAGPPGVDMSAFMGTPGELIADTNATEARAILSGQAAIVPAGQAAGGGGNTIIIQGDVLDANDFFRKHAQSLGIGLEELDEDGGLI